MAGFSRGECNGYIILKSKNFGYSYFGSVLLFACAMSAAEGDEEERVVCVCHTK